ncbi:MAG: hypothetical protein R2745_13150 [Vicinamibacterales bacterium]
MTPSRERTTHRTGTRVSPGGDVAFSALVTAGAVGAAALFSWLAYRGWRDGQAHWEWFLPFAVLLVPIAGALLWFLPGQLSRLGYPRPVLHVDPDPLVLGGAADVRWSFDGDVARLRTLHVWLEGYEWRPDAELSSGPGRSVFARIDVARVHAPEGRALAASGAGRVQVPLTTMHTFGGHWTRVDWALVLEAAMSRGPELTARVPVTVVAPPARMA